MCLVNIANREGLCISIVAKSVLDLKFYLIKLRFHCNFFSKTIHGSLRQGKLLFTVFHNTLKTKRKKKKLNPKFQNLKQPSPRNEDQ